jgi:hypothetical protein
MTDVPDRIVMTDALPQVLKLYLTTILASSRDAWIKRGYPALSGSAIAAPPPREGFTRLYHLCPAHHALDNVRKRRLKVATFKDANDPFELSVFFSKDADEQSRLNDTITEVGKHTGAVCFSADWQDPVLWSHYADKHRGIALGFDVSNDAYLLAVKYQTDRVEFPALPLTGEIVDRVFGTKFLNWQYEREWRLVVELDRLNQARAIEKMTADVDQTGFYFLGFEPTRLELREVILGPLCTETIDTVRELTGSQYSVTTFRARLGKKFFSIVPDEKSLDWFGIIKSNDELLDDFWKGRLDFYDPNAL